MKYRKQRRGWLANLAHIAELASQGLDTSLAEARLVFRRASCTRCWCSGTSRPRDQIDIPPGRCASVSDASRRDEVPIQERITVTGPRPGSCAGCLGSRPVATMLGAADPRARSRPRTVCCRPTFVARKLAVILHRMWAEVAEFRWGKESGRLPPHDPKRVASFRPRAEPCRSRGDDGRGDPGESPEPEGSKASKLVGQIETPALRTP